MSIIDKQRIAAVRTLEAMGYVFRDEWIAPACKSTPATAEADAMHSSRAARRSLDGCTEGRRRHASLRRLPRRWRPTRRSAGRQA